jgi:hypothetical protein
VWLQVAKQLVLCSLLCMKKITLRIGNDSLVAIRIAQDIRKHHDWFYELVDSIGVRFCGIETRVLGTSSEFFEIDMEELECIDEDLQHLNFISSHVSFDRWGQRR